MKRIRTEREIPVGPEKLWAVLAGFGRYAEWNPLNVWAEGEARLGARIPMRFVDAGGGKGQIISQTVVVTGLDRGRYLEWTGRVPLLFKGRHFFQLTPTPSGTHFLHGEDLSGLAPALFPAARIARQKAAYERFNEAIEQRAMHLGA